mmetsp:Transcript_7259/g.10396  ORF Transcript_7259/g.10396 Transcript_7259/m.10396 type:complete len:378 (+) Transcript_7259:97-1230(+)|eukprot:CAMPEP_0184860646 /NCGR_PEP_ID=MMETSP0580-20130426/5508_1 /TAXON_ID=1118495 /ORGANISM="Dactyliosolen fragilissimus" /LENGTH=377 /DNA_ID=CAMNT_0027357845 /DNA_START=33 /DNA_END=1166 /DNA_ORIENTATION=-
MTTIDEKKLKNEILATLEERPKRSINVKDLRKVILVSCDMDKNDKSVKKMFKAAVQSLEKEERIDLNQEGLLKLIKKRKDKKSSKRKKDDIIDEATLTSNDADDINNNENSSITKENNETRTNKKVKRQMEKDATTSSTTTSTTDNFHQSDQEIQYTDESNNKAQSDNLNSSKNDPCEGNPDGVTRMFVGNLPYKVDEASLEEFLSPAKMTHVKWITDKLTGKFYGSSFVEMRNSLDAAQAMQNNGSKLMGRLIKINYAPAREGEIWPPKNKVVTGGKTAGGQAGGSGIKAMSEKPDGCLKLFIGNLSYDIDEDALCKFFATVDAEVKAVRWLHHKDTGDFKGVGFVEFWKTDACERAATLNGKDLLGRPIRIDWTD